MNLNAELAEDSMVLGLFFILTLFYIVSGLKRKKAAIISLVSPFFNSEMKYGK